MIELPQYAESLHQPVPTIEELSIRMRAVFQPLIDAFRQVAQAISEVLQPFFRALHKIIHPHSSRQERHFFAVIHKSEQKKRYVVRAKSRRPTKHTVTAQDFATQVQHFQGEIKSLMIEYRDAKN